MPLDTPSRTLRVDVRLDTSSNEESLPDSKELRVQEAADVMASLTETLVNPPFDINGDPVAWEPPQLSRQGVVTLVKHVARLKDEAQRGN